ncbi:DUF5979 domain-containing protein [Roseburia hominis]
MNRIRRKKGYIAGVLALVLAVSGMHLMAARAAGTLDFDSHTCSLTLETTGIEFAKELSGVPEIPVKLYQVATMDRTAGYTVDTERYGSDIVIEDKRDDRAAWAQQWKDLAQKVTEKIEAEGSAIKEDATVMMHPVAETDTSYSRGTAENLDPGLYLVKAEKVQHDGYEYSFSPYLISVPTSEYRMGEGTGDDEWLYDVTVGLKPARKPLEGEMEIQKTLNTYNESLGEVTFVFEVTGTDPVTGEVVYNNVVSMNFDDGTPIGTQTVKITGLPVGTVVTVKEIYNGAGYTEVSGDYTTTIEPSINDDSGNPISQTKPVTFVNDYDDKLKKGYGIVNHFDFVGDEAYMDEDGNLVVRGHYEWEKWFTDSVEAEAEAGPTGKGFVPEEAKQSAQ